MDGLPEELLAEILCRLPPRSLAACRSVRNDWCATIDARGMLLAVAHLVPHHLRGIYIDFFSQDRPYFFSREPTSPAIDAALDFMQVRQSQWYGRGAILDHRNGLLLYKKLTTLSVCNPATRRWADLPVRPFPDWCGSEYLMFDPTVSLHYDVLFFPEPPVEHCATEHDLERLFPKCPSLGADWKHRRVTNRGLGTMAWPPESYLVQVFPSRTGQWEERRFVREDDTTVKVSDVWSDPCGGTSNRRAYNVRRYHAVYWREEFYLHSPGGFIIRFSLQKLKYLVIKTPRLDNIFWHQRLDNFFSHQRLAEPNDRRNDIIPRVYLGKSQQGIYYTALFNNQLQVWVLHEVSDSRGVPKWQLKHQAFLECSFSRHYAQRHIERKLDESWNLDRGDKKGRTNDRRDHEWDSDNDSLVDGDREEDGEEEVRLITNYWDESTNEMPDILGFHPHKEIIFFGRRFEGLAYYLSSSKLQYLGLFRPAGWLLSKKYEAFIYTPCMYDMLPLREEEDDDYDEDGDNDEDDDDDEYDDNDDDDEDYDDDVDVD